MDGGYWLVAMKAAHEAPFREHPVVDPRGLGRHAAVAAGRPDCACTSSGRGVTSIPMPISRPVATRSIRRGAPHTAGILRELGERGIVGEEATPQLISSELLSVSLWRAVLSDEVRRPDGRASAYTYLAVPRAVFVVAITPGRDVVLVRQYRHPVRDWTLEVPAGAVEDGESALDAARRELDEEVGGSSQSWRHLSTFYSSSAHLSLRSDAFLALDVELSEPHPDDEESLATVRMPLGEALARARAGGFVEGQTALALLLAAQVLGDDRP